MKIKKHKSPNYWEDRKGYDAKAFVIHITDGNFQSAHNWFMNPDSDVSAHYIIKRNGEIHQYVHPDDGAWHAGVVKEPNNAKLPFDGNPNYWGIGIEHEGNGNQEFTSQQVRSGLKLIKALATYYQIPIKRKYFVNHRDIRADKTCPGVKNSADIYYSLLKYRD